MLIDERGRWDFGWYVSPTLGGNIYEVAVSHNSLEMGGVKVGFGGVLYSKALGRVLWPVSVLRGCRSELETLS